MSQVVRDAARRESVRLYRLYNSRAVSTRVSRPGDRRIYDNHDLPAVVQSVPISQSVRLCARAFRFSFVLL